MLDNKITSNSVEKSDNKFAFLAFAKGQYISKYETENIWNINFSQNTYKRTVLSWTIV